MSGVSQYQARGTPAANGSYAYAAGASGVVNVPAGAYLSSVACVAGAVDATVQIDARPTVTVPAGRAFTQDVQGGIVGPAVVTFTNTVTYLVEWLAV